MNTIKVRRLLLACTLLISAWGVSQEQEALYGKMAKVPTKQNQTTMNTYVIEREIPNAGELTQEQLQGISKTSNEVISEMDAVIEWVHSYVTDNKVYCVYKAQSEDAIREHAEKGGFPVNNVSELTTIISPKTGGN